MTHQLLKLFKEQCSREIIYRSDCPDLMREQCIQEKFDGNNEAYRYWARCCREEQKNKEKAQRVIEKPKVAKRQAPKATLAGPSVAKAPRTVEDDEERPAESIGNWSDITDMSDWEGDDVAV